MPLGFSLVIIVLGVIAVVGLVHLTGGSASRRFADEAEVIRAWSFDHPDEPVRDVILSKVNRAALINTAEGEGLIWSFGAQSVTRKLEPGLLRRVVEHPRGLCLEFAEFDAPRVVLDLTGAEVASWTAFLSRFERS